MDTNERNPYAPPQSNVELAPPPLATTPPLWNPNVAGILSLFFTPIFGAILHMKNWQALGEPQKAAASRAWAWVSAAVVILTVLFELIGGQSRSFDGVARIANFALLFAWYFSSGKPQQNYVRERFGKNYPRRGFGKPVGIALLIMVGFVVVIVAIGVVLALVAQRFQ